MKKLLAILAALGMLAFAAPALAQTADPSTGSGASGTVPQSDTSAMSKVAFPIAELGGCDSREACKLYCDDASHREACFTFAQKNGLMTKEKVAAAKLILSKKGPGGCSSKDSCKAFCEDSANQAECLSFAEEHKIIPGEKAALIRKLTTGAGPGACKSSETCRTYCEDVSHQAECKAFAEENGLLRKMASSTAERVRAVIASTTPGRDRGMELKAIHSSTTPPGIIKGDERKASSTQEVRKPLPPKNPAPRPTPTPSSSNTNDGLGAAVLRGFARLLGF